MRSDNANPRLFVYGTLRSGYPSGESNRLAPAKLVATGRVPGVLYELEGYPGAVSAPEGEEWIVGEVVELENFAGQIRILDQYEGCDDAAPSPHEYRRELTTVRLDNGDSLSAWIYWYQGPTEGRRHIPSGDWC
ncbi:MAG TPA: gamma-glutamylcyclotransferase family protein [Chthoniobacterales bacterium]